MPTSIVTTFGVYVTYLWRTTVPPISVTFGFPVDLAAPETLNTPNGYDYVLGSSLTDFHVEDGGKPVPIEKRLPNRSALKNGQLGSIQKYNSCVAGRS